nr:DUF202 domain-containing protein [Gordonia araii]
MALERTTMAWTRTSTSLIAFGFTIYQFLQHRVDEHYRTVASPWSVGMLMIGAGLVCLVLAVYQERRELAVLRKEDPGVRRTLTTPLVTAIAILGIAAFVTVGWRV